MTWRQDFHPLENTGPNIFKFSNITYLCYASYYPYCSFSSDPSCHIPVSTYCTPNSECSTNHPSIHPHCLSSEGRVLKLASICMFSDCGRKPQHQDKTHRHMGEHGNSTLDECGKTLYIEHLIQTCRLSPPPPSHDSLMLCSHYSWRGTNLSVNLETSQTLSVPLNTSCPTRSCYANSTAPSDTAGVLSRALGCFLVNKCRCWCEHILLNPWGLINLLRVSLTFFWIF